MFISDRGISARRAGVHTEEPKSDERNRRQNRLSHAGRGITDGTWQIQKNRCGRSQNKAGGKWPAGFSELIEGEKYSVDRTGCLKELNCSWAPLFVGPRRFGKTPNMIQAFCELNYRNPRHPFGRSSSSATAGTLPWPKMRIGKCATASWGNSPSFLSLSRRYRAGITAMQWKTSLQQSTRSMHT